MALVTIQRSPSPSTDPELDGVDSTEDASEGKSQLRKRSKTSREKLRKIFSTVRFISKLRPCLSESYFTVKGAALILPHNECTKKTSKKSHGGEIQSHLQSMLHLLRPEDTIKIAVRLEDVNCWSRYMALVSTRGRQDTEEAVILGIDCSITEAFIGLVLPIWMGLKLKLGGDGGFSLCTDEQRYLFKPVSVQAMWSAIQSLVKVMHIAEDMKYIHDGLTHTWVGYYKSHIDRRDAARALAWNVEGVEVFAPSSLSIKTDDEDKVIKQAISQKLKEVMMSVDLDEATSVMLRKKVEEGLGMSLIEFKSYFDEEVMRILGQMDEPSKILDYLYLGSEWNASNLDELNSKGIGYILNVTREIDNFFVGMFQYYNVRVLDVEEEELLRHWDKTYKFITKARNHNSKVLVHCKMGVSRSASTVMAYLMKEKRWTVSEAFDFVKERRGCVNPNPGFMEQLSTYQGILTASNQRDIFRSKSNQNLLEENPAETAELGQGSFLGASLFTMMSHSDWPMASGGVALKEEWLSEMLTSDFAADRELEAAESRSADSVEEAVPDVRTPPPIEVFDFSQDLPSSCASSSAASFSRACLDRQISPDSEMTESGPYASLASSSQHSGSLGPRIKPDSSWIKLETEDSNIDKVEDCIVRTDSIHIPDSKTLTCFNTQGTAHSPELGDTHIDSAGSTSGYHLTNAVEAASPSLSHFSPSAAKIQVISAQDDAKCDPAKFTIGDIQICRELASDSPCIVDSISNNPLSIYYSSTDLEDNFSTAVDAGTSGLLVSTSSPEVSDIEVTDHSIEEKELLSATGDKTDDPKTAKIAISRIEMGVRQYFLKEKIPWNIGKVKKMREDINKTGQILQDFEINKMDIKSPEQEIIEFKDKESNDDFNLLDRTAYHQHPTLSQSQSCMELSSMADMDGGYMSLYEREEIPLEPGTVRRTKQEIENRQRFFSGEGDEDIFYSTRPVQRSSSLKHEGEKSRLKTYRRLTHCPILSPIWGKSLNDLSSLDLSDHTLTSLSSASSIKKPEKPPLRDDSMAYPAVAANVTLHILGDEATPIKSGLVRKQKMELEGRYEPDKGQYRSLVSPEMTHPVAILGYTSSDLDHAKIEPVEHSLLNSNANIRDMPLEETHLAKSNLDSKTLALIREIGSALLMSPASSESSEKDEESCTNKVKYLVRKIEKKTNSAVHVENPGLDAESKRFEDKFRFSSNKDRVSGRTLSTGDIDTSSFSESWQKLASPSAIVRHAFKPDKQECHSPTSRSFNLRLLPEDKHNVAPSSLEFVQAEPITFVCGSSLASSSAVSSPQSSTYSPHSPLGDASMEPSVVRNLVDKFETQAPEVDQNITSYSDFPGGLASTCSSEQSNCTALDNLASPSLDRSLFTHRCYDKSKATSVSLDIPFSASLQTLSNRQVSLDSGMQLPSKNTTKLSTSPFEIKVELYETTDTVMRPTASKQGKIPLSSTTFDKPAPLPFNKINLQCSEPKAWRPVRPLSAECPSTGSESSPSSDRSKGRRSLGFEEFQPNEEGRKIRRLQHGKSHPLTHLTENPLRKGPFYSSM
ncbi:protein phosphatase Slingshot 1 isoform X1 [Biomphalaria glabrata]|nr:protein phosphatase Slingshot 1 isoform X1 [Biomphalaria glabrata]